MIELLYDLMDMDVAEHPRHLIEEARLRQGALPYLILSLLAGQTSLTGEVSRAELARARHREQYLAELCADIRGACDVDVMKGPEIARWYPPGVVRGHTDLDLVCADEQVLWQVVRRVQETADVDRIDLSVVDDESGTVRHLVVSLAWPSTDPLVDPGFGVDVSTVAFVGDCRMVPMVAGLPRDPVLACLLSVAEERFQREFLPRDVLDVTVLPDQAWPDPGTAVDVIAATHRAPEAVELLELVLRYAPRDVVAGLAARLRPAAEAERDRRAAAQSLAVAPPGVARVRYGYPLGELLRRTGVQCLLHSVEGGEVLVTPVGDYLLTETSRVGQEQVDAALSWLGTRAGS